MSDKTQIKLLLFFQMDVPQKEGEPSDKMPDYGLWQTTALNEVEGAYELTCVMPFHKDRKAGDKMWVYPKTKIKYH